MRRPKKSHSRLSGILRCRPETGEQGGSGVRLSAFGILGREFTLPAPVACVRWDVRRIALGADETSSSEINLLANNQFMANTPYFVLFLCLAAIQVGVSASSFGAA